MKPFQGGCACGAIRYKAAAEPIFVMHCHCTDCQKTTGAHMATVVGVPADAFSVEQGTTKVYPTRGDSGGKVHRSFCADCGSTLFSTADAMQGLCFVDAGSLDDASWLVPTAHIYTSSAQPWARIPEDMVQYAKLPPAGG
jgi:hypothetical protein